MMMKSLVNSGGIIKEISDITQTCLNMFGMILLNESDDIIISVGSSIHLNGPI